MVGLRSEKCGVEVGFKFYVLGDICVKTCIGTKSKVHKLVKKCERRVNNR